MFDALQNEFEGELYFKNTTTDKALKKVYSTDASVYQEEPLAVAIPKTVNDIKKLIKFADNEQITLIPRAAGTSLAGQVVGKGLVVDISKKFINILEVNQAEKWVRVQPGVIRDDLNAYLKPYGLMFGPETSTSSRAMIGGMIGNNSCGLHSIIWGATRDNLLEVKALLSDGSEVFFANLDKKYFQEKCKLATLDEKELTQFYLDVCLLVQCLNWIVLLKLSVAKFLIFRNNYCRYYNAINLKKSLFLIDNLGLLQL